MKILITGANGYLGVGIVKQLLDDGNTVVATDIILDKCDTRAELSACDLFEIDDPYSYFHCPDVVLHLAWRNGFKHNDCSHIEDLPKHHRFLEKIFASAVKRVAVMGTMHEVGFYEGSIDADTPCTPMNLYGIAKNALRCAAAALSKAHDTPFQWLRGYYIVGNTPYGASVFSKLYQAALDGKKEFPFTGGVNQYDFLDYDEFCYQVAAAVEQDGELGIINICSGFPEKLSVRVEKFIRDNRLPIKLLYGAFPDRQYDSKAVWGNNKIIDRIVKEKVTKECKLKF